MSPLKRALKLARSGDVTVRTIEETILAALKSERRYLIKEFARQGRLMDNLLGEGNRHWALINDLSGIIKRRK